MWRKWRKYKTLCLSSMHHQQSMLFGASKLANIASTVETQALDRFFQAFLCEDDTDTFRYLFNRDVKTPWLWTSSRMVARSSLPFGSVILLMSALLFPSFKTFMTKTLARFILVVSVLAFKPASVQRGLKSASGKEPSADRNKDN